MDELDDMGEHADAAPATPAATLVVFRHDPTGGPAQILMVERSGSLSFAGGATVFPDIGLEVAAIRGHACFFSYDRPDPVTRTLHGGTPVTAGEKWIATRWMRESPYR